MGRLGRILGPSWSRLGRMAASWSRPGTTSGRSWAVLGAYWGILAHHGGVLGASCGILEAFRDNFHVEVRFFIGFIRLFEKIAFGSERRFFYAMLVPNWLDAGIMLVVRGGAGGILGRLGRFLAPLGGLLGRLWPVLCATWRVLARLGASWARLGTSWVRLGAFWLAKPPQDKSASRSAKCGRAPSPPSPPPI